MTTKNFFNRASWIILIVLFIPAGAVQASKDAVPGDSIYPIKLVLEDALLLMMKPSKAATSDMEMKFTKRRLLEVEQVADTAFVVDSLKSLNEQVTDTTTSIGEVKNLNKQSQLVDEYIQTLRETQASLERQRVATTYPHRGGSGQAASTIDPDEIRREIERTKAEIAAEIERLRQVALENERLRREQALQDQQAAQEEIFEAQQAQQAAEQAAQEASDQQAAQEAAYQAAQEAAAQQAADQAAYQAAQQAAQEAAYQAAQEAAAAQQAAQEAADQQSVDDQQDSWDGQSNNNQWQGQGQGQGNNDDDDD